MARFRRLRWIAVMVLAITAAVTVAVGAEAFADQTFAARGNGPCQPPAAVAQASGNHSWRTGGFRSAGCRAWRHLHRPRSVARTR